jgi:hypothetical protein
VKDVHFSNNIFKLELRAKIFKECILCVYIVSKIAMMSVNFPLLLAVRASSKIVGIRKQARGDAFVEQLFPREQLPEINANWQGRVLPAGTTRGSKNNK